MRKIALTILIFLLGVNPNLHSQAEELSISDAIAKALENNYGIQISRSDLDIARINNSWGTAGRYPSIGFDAASNNSMDLAGENNSSVLTASLGLSWILFDGFRVKITKGRLENTEDLVSGQLAVQVENTIEDIYLAYYQVLVQQERLEVLKTVMDLSKDRYDYEQKRRSLGSSASYQVLQAESNYLGDRSAFLEQEMLLRNARRNFNYLLAEDVGKSYVFAEEFVADTSEYKLDQLQTKMMSNNQLLKNQYTNLMLRQDDSELKKAENFPTISLGSGLSSGYASGNSSLSAYGNVRLSYDIYAGGNRKRAIEIARINEEIAGIGIEQIELSLINELYTLYDNYEVRKTLLQVADQAFKTAELNLKLSDEKYRAGAINSFNYRDVQLLYLEASLRRIQAIYKLIDSHTRLTRITGGYLNMSDE